MNPLAFPLLADENIHPQVTAALTAAGKDVRAVQAEGLAGHSDIAVLRQAVEVGRVVLTHDGDFGLLALAAGEPYIGIIYLRPGHILPAVVLETLRAIEEQVIDVDPPFLLVAERRQQAIRIRVRRG
jgi:predicted nuclease of predicted toxin-antitoxin system